MKHKLFKISAIAFVLLATLPAFADYKIKQRMTINDQVIETTILVKGSRQRTESSGYMGMGSDVSTIEQCDMKRNIQVNDGKKLYFIAPFADAPDGADSTIQNPQSKPQKGGTITMTYVITDTGERKTMFGLTARHIKTTMMTQASPDACTKDDMRIETDGWYVDLPQFSCPLQPPSNPMMRGTRGGCQDRFIVKQTGGAGKLGFPLTLTQTFGDAGFTQTIETVEFSSATLDAAMFDIPKDYTLAKTSQELYGKPDMNAIMQSANNNNNSSMSSSSMKNNSASTTKKAGTIRIGVLAVSNQTSESISGENLRSFLIEKLTDGNVEAVSINSEADAKAMSCDYVLTTDVSKLKQSAASKIGGMFGKVTGTDTSAAQKFEALINFKLTTPDGQIVTQNKISQKTEGNAEAVAQSALGQTIRPVLDAANRKN